MRKLLTFISCIFLSASGVCQDIRIARTAATAGIRLTEHATYFVDSSGTSQWGDIAGKPDAFLGYSEPKAFFSFSRYGIWIKCRIRNESSERQSLYMLVDNYRIEMLRLFIQKTDKSIIRFPMTGWGTPIGQRPYPHYKNIFPFEIDANEEMTFYLFSKTRYHPFNVPVTFTDRQDLTEHVLITTLSDGFVLIISLFVFLISLFLLFESEKKDSLYFWYCVYSFHCFIYFFLRIGIQYFNEAPLDPFINYLAEIPTVINLLSYAFFATSFMASVKVNPVCSRLLHRALTGAGIASIIAYFVGPIPNQPFILIARTLLFITFLAAIFYPLIRGIRQRNRDAYLFLVMLIPLLAAYILLVWSSDIAPEGGSSDQMLLMKSAILLEASLMMFSVFYKSGRIKKELFKKIAENEKQALRTQIEVQESERRRIASDLHDELGANIATIKRDIKELEEMHIPEPAKNIIQRAKVLISQTSQDLRRITHNLMPPHFEVIGLKDSLQHLTKRAESKKLKFEFVIFGTIRKLSYEEEINLYRIVSELVHNIQKHADASVASVQMIYFEDKLTINVEDNGKGFESGDAVKNGIGLNTVRLRVGYIGASLNLDSGQSGSSVTIELPYK